MLKVEWIVRSFEFRVRRKDELQTTVEIQCFNLSIEDESQTTFQHRTV
jgi:hypothetical protein